MLREFANRSIAKGAGPWGRSCWNSTGAGTLADDCLVLTNGKFPHFEQPSPPAFTLPYTAPKRKGGDLFETRQEANQEAEDPARTSGPLAGELARREAEAERGARHPPQAHGHDPGRPSPGTVTPTHRKEGTAA